MQPRPTEGMKQRSADAVRLEVPGPTRERQRRRACHSDDKNARRARVVSRTRRTQWRSVLHRNWRRSGPILRCRRQRKQLVEKAGTSWPTTYTACEGRSIQWPLANLASPRSTTGSEEHRESQAQVSRSVFRMVGKSARLSPPPFCRHRSPGRYRPVRRCLPDLHAHRRLECVAPAPEP